MCECPYTNTVGIAYELIVLGSALHAVKILKLCVHSENLPGVGEMVSVRKSNPQGKDLADILAGGAAMKIHILFVGISHGIQVFPQIFSRYLHCDTGITHSRFRKMENSRGQSVIGDPD